MAFEGQLMNERMRKLILSCHKSETIPLNALSKSRDYLLCIRSSEIGIRLSSALLWGGVATILGRGLPLLAMMLTARVLGTEEFGKLMLLYSTTLAFEVFVTAGLSVTCTKFVADLHRTDPQRTGRVIDLANIISAIAALLIGGLLICFASTISQHVLAAPELTTALYWVAALVALLSFSGIQQGILVGFEAFRVVSLIELAGGISILFLVPICGLIFGMQGAFWGLILGYALRLSAQHFAVAKQIATRGIQRQWAFPKDELAILWQFSLPGMLNSVVYGPVAWLAIAVVARQPNGAAEVGIFYAANQWFSLLLFLPTILNQVAFPIMTERLNAGWTDTAWRLFYGKILATVGVVTLAVLVVGFISPFIMDFYGVEYASKWHVLLVVILAAWISAPLGPMGNMLIAHTKQWSWFVANLVWAGCLLFVVYMLRHHGAFALAWAHVAAYLGKWIFTATKINQLRQFS
jgi:O-antigen/teichoic acid export membrane protein